MNSVEIVVSIHRQKCIASEITCVENLQCWIWSYRCNNKEVFRLHMHRLKTGFELAACIYEWACASASSPGYK